MTKPTIIADGIVLTCDATNRCGRYNILVSNGRILSISENLDSLTKEHPDATIIDAKDKLIVPGFVNAHYHGESFLLRALTKGAHFGLWEEDAQLSQARNKLLHSSSYDDVRRIYLAASLAHLRSGTTCVGEFPPLLGEDGFVQMLDAIASTGVLGVVALQNWDQIRKVQSLREKKPKVAVSLGKEKDFTVYSIEKLSQSAKELKAPLLAHIAEQREDVEVVRNNFQKDILTLLNSFNAIRRNTILVHANHTTEEEVMMVKEVGGTVVVCARSTAAKQTGYPALRHLAKLHVRLCLGTDWGSVDMIEEMRFMSQLPLIVPGLRVFSSLEILRMATINGAIALGLHNELGSIEVSKHADLTFFNVADIRLPRLHSNSSAEELAEVIVHDLTSGGVADVMMNGEFKVSDGKVVSLSEPDILKEFQSTYEKFIPDTALSRAQPLQPQAEPTPNVLPFIADVRSSQDETEGFEAGFPAIPKQATIVEIADTPVNPLVKRPKPNSDPIRPELPKNTRRVFGDDEEL